MSPRFREGPRACFWCRSLVTTDRTIALWLRKTQALADLLMVDPVDVYSTLVERGYTEDRQRQTLSIDQAVVMVASVFRSEEVLPVSEVTRRVEKHEDFATVAKNDASRYVRAILSRHSGEFGKKRFLRVMRGGYRLQLNNHELRSAIVSELRQQRQFVGSRRLTELFGVPYDRIVEVLAPLASKGEVVSRVNSATQARDWCLERYAEVFNR